MGESVRETILGIIGKAVAAADPHEAVRRHLSRSGSRLVAGGTEYDLESFDRLVVIGAGKASAPMAVAAEEILGDRLTVGVVVVKEGHAESTRQIDIVEASHPEPDSRGAEGARKILDIVSAASPESLIIAVFSGGGSALLPLYPEDIDFDDMRDLTSLLLRCGATINEINAVRKHLSLVQGGRIAQAAGGATIVSLLVSDVVGNPIDVIASGPTCADPSTFTEALSVLEKYELTELAPVRPVERLKRGARGEIDETPKPGDPALQNVTHLIIADNDLAATSAAAAATQAGFRSKIITTHLEGEAREVARVLGAIAKDLVLQGRPVSPPSCLILGGETTVTVTGNGKGGRNQEMALAAAIAIQGLRDVAILCFGTDGNDGPTDAAGGLVDGNTISRAGSVGMDASQYLAENNSYEFLRAVDALVVTGPTRTNVNDLAVVFALEGLP